MANVVPGESVVFNASVHNDGASAESARLEVGGDGRPYSYVVPDSVSVEPGGVVEVRVGFRMPLTSVPAAGPLPFDVRRADTREVLASGVVEVAPFSLLSVAVEPIGDDATGPVSTKVTVGNRGNAPVGVTLSADVGEAEVDVRFTPETVEASSGQSASAQVDITPKGRNQGEISFKVVATPAFGKPSEVAVKFVQHANGASKTFVRSGLVAGAVVIALVVGLVAFRGGSGSDSTTDVAAAGNEAPNDACPAENHSDPRGISGLRPDDIPRLPNSYPFLFVKADGCTPVRFNPCEPIHYVQNTALAPPTGATDVREAFNRLSQVTGITFVDDGETTEVARGRSHYLPERYGERWAPILVSWTRFPSTSNDPTIQAVGRGIGQRVGDVLVSGQLSLNVDAVTDRDARTPLEGGYGPPLGSGVGAIGPKGVTWGRIILHELAHVMGLGHTRDKGSIMYPESADQTSRPANFTEPDRLGLRYLGRDMGCLPTPPPA